MSKPDPIKAIRDMAAGYAARNVAQPSLLRDLVAAADAIEEQRVQTAIDVLKAYADDTLRTDLCDELDAAIERAFNTLSSTWTDHDPWE